MTLACHIYVRIKLCKQTRRGIFSSRKHSTSLSRGNGDNNANKEDGGQGRGVQGAGCREQGAETGSEAYFPLKMPQYVDFKQRQRQRQRAERTSTRQPDRQQQFNIHIYFYSHFISLGSRYCWLYYFYCCCSCSYYCCLSWQLCQRSHVNICTPFLEQVSRRCKAKKLYRVAKAVRPKLKTYVCFNVARRH